MTWAARTSPIRAGDTVQYSRRFLQDTGQVVGDLGYARGTVMGFRTIGDTRLAVMEWQDADLPELVNVANLSRVESRGVAE